MQQKEWALHWEEMEELFAFPKCLLAYAVDGDVFTGWSSQVQDMDILQPFTGQDSGQTLSSQAIFLALALLHLQETNRRDSGLPPHTPGEFVFSAMAVFVHPCQCLWSIAGGVHFLFQKWGDVEMEP